MLTLRYLLGLEAALEKETPSHYRLVQTISIELIVFGFVISFYFFYMQFFAMVYLIAAGIIISALNLYLLKLRGNVKIAAYILTLNILIIFTLGNFWLIGLSVTFFAWFYIIPIMAAATIGLMGLAVFSIPIIIFSVIFFYFDIDSIYYVTPPHLIIVEIVNSIAILILMYILLFSLLRDNQTVSALLKEQNYLLGADKKKFHYLARHDTLTNLPNRSHFISHLQSLIESVNTASHSATVYFMDLDGFKEINDIYGHDIGDRLLLQAAKRLQHCFRKADFVARLGGDEFTAVIIHTNNGNVHYVLAERILREFNKPFLLDDLKLSCPMSLGMATYPQDTTSLEKLLNKADKAMYAAKKRRKKIN